MEGWYNRVGDKLPGQFQRAAAAVTGGGGVGGGGWWVVVVKKRSIVQKMKALSKK